MDSWSEKEKAITELLKQKKQYREIEQQLHVSSRDISRIKKKNDEQNSVIKEGKQKVEQLNTSQVMKLFHEGKGPVEVVIDLDMKPDEVDILYKLYCRMTSRTKLNEIYDKLGDNIFPFIGLYEITEKEGMRPQQVVNALKIAEELSDLEVKYQVINDNIEWAKREMLEVNKQKALAQEDLKSVREAVESAREEAYKLKLEFKRKYVENQLNKFKECFVNQLRPILEDGANQLKSAQERIDGLKQEEEQLTSRIQRLKSEEETQVKQQQNIQIDLSPPQPQLIFQKRQLTQPV